MDWYTAEIMSEKLIHEVIPVGMLQCNCSILGDPVTREAIVVDPGDDVGRILEILQRHGLKLRAIVSTHTHIDHVGGLAELHRATGAPVMIHEADMELYKHLDMQAQWLGVPTPAMTRIEDFVKEGDAVRWGGFAARVLHTPGHTPGSISLVIEPGVTGTVLAEGARGENRRARASSRKAETRGAGDFACGRYVVSAKYRADGFVGRVHAADSEIDSREAAGAAGRDDCVSRARRYDDDWRGAGAKSVFALLIQVHERSSREVPRCTRITAPMTIAAAIPKLSVSFSPASSQPIKMAMIGLM